MVVVLLVVVVEDLLLVVVELVVLLVVLVLGRVRVEPDSVTSRVSLPPGVVREGSPETKNGASGQDKDLSWDQWDKATHIPWIRKLACAFCSSSSAKM